jgi:hypothetical protein
METSLQADPKIIIPPYLELDRSDRNIVDLSVAMPVSSIDSFHTVKKYFFRLSSRNEAGYSWCSVNLALSIPFSQFMEKVRYSYENQNFSLWPKASDNGMATDVGWLLYSTRQQDEERLAPLLTTLSGYNLGVKWKPIRMTKGLNRKKDPQDLSEKINALHVKCAMDKVQEVRKKLSFWYDSASITFPDGTKMRLVPTFSSILSTQNKAKFASCLARQAALSSGMAVGTTWEMSTNLMLDVMDPSSKKTFQQIMMSIKPMDSNEVSLFHTIDKQWRSDNVITFTFRPKHESEACAFIAGLIPFLRDEGNSYFLKMFSAEAQQRHATSKWDAKTRQVTSVEEEELNEFLSADEDLNLSDKPTQEKPSKEVQENENENKHVAFDIPEFTPVNFPSITNDVDSVSTFHPSRTSRNKQQISAPVLDVDSISRMSDTADTTSTLKSSVSDLNSLIQSSFNELSGRQKSNSNKGKLFKDFWHILP